MKVLHFYKTCYPDSFGGVEQVIHQLAHGSAVLGVETTILSLTPKRDDRIIEVGGYKVVRCYSNFKLASTDFSLSAFWSFNELVKNADIVHYHFPWPFMDLVHLLLGIKKPSIVTYHSDIVKQKNLVKLYRPLKNKFLKSVGSIVATSPNYLETSDVLQFYRDKVEVIPIGLDKSLYPSVNVERSKFWQNKLGGKFFLFIGVLRYYKGLHILLDALALGDLPTVIIGAGPIELELKLKAASLGLKNIIFLGRVSEEDKIAILDLSYAIVFPSHLRSEAFGISLLEGAMFGKPMISSEIGTGTSFINSDHETGIVIPPSSPKDLHAAMVYLWNNKTAASMMGLNAFVRYKKFFTADKMCQSYKSLYQRLIYEKSK
ncbi:glycosyltransferase [Polynucleobacter sp. MWH-Berg-3C6]|uniref:glycosyltransferase n=1 Tax=Polynucleobacter sp. MWH-Berg-3C6 TaxID=1855882 RepID=UPI001C0D62AC|nr:glycosyltransferase [Polynucleobacter sp. MWH-Berg-3C6]MBU3549916.1 glycosyltransferase [Polynucleobacter sp. MWH-Berg-3C6]